MRSLSQAERQENFLKSGFLDLNDFGTKREDATVYEFKDIEGTLVYLAALYIEKAKEKLNIRDAVASGALLDSIVPTQVQIFGKIYSIEIKLNDYYKFVDEGVKGWADEKGSGSKYQFKNTRPSKKMVTAIRKWLIREGLKGKGAENKKSLKKRDRRRASITDTSTRMAYAISYNIKKKGLRATHFWQDTHKEMIGIVREELGKSLKVDIINMLTNGNSN